MYDECNLSIPCRLYISLMLLKVMVLQMICLNRPRSAQSAVAAHRRYSSSTCALAVSPEKHALTDPEALTSDPDDDDDDEQELVRGTSRVKLKVRDSAFCLLRS